MVRQAECGVHCGTPSSRLVAKQSRWNYLAAGLLAAALATVLAACGGGGGGGPRPRDNRQVFQGVQGVRQLQSRNPRAASQINNVGQAQSLMRDALARPINPSASNRFQVTPAEALYNAANLLSDEEVVSTIRELYPNALTLDDFGVEIDFDETPAELDLLLAGGFDEEFRSRSTRSPSKLFKGKLRVRTESETSASRQVEVTCQQGFGVTQEGDPQEEIRLEGQCDLRIPNQVSQNQPARAEIDFDRLKIFRPKRGGTPQQQDRPSDTIVLGDEQKDEWCPVVIQPVDADDSTPAFDIESWDWNATEIAWIDDDWGTYLDEDLLSGLALVWLLESDGFWSIYDESDDLSCIGFFGAEWVFQPVARTQRQAEVLLPFTFDWEDQFTGCGALSDYDILFTLEDVVFVLDEVSESEFDIWCEETDAELDAYIAALLNLPPGADLADTVLTAEAWVTGLPQFMYDVVYQLHLLLDNPPAGISVSGNYPSNYTATFSDYGIGSEEGTIRLNGRIRYQFTQVTQEVWQLRATFEEFVVRGETEDPFVARLGGTVEASFNNGRMELGLRNFAFEIEGLSRGNSNGTLVSDLTLEDDTVVAVRTSQANLNLSMTNLSVTPSQNYTVTVTLNEPLVWPVDECAYSTDGVLDIRGQLAGEQIRLLVDFGQTVCGKAIITSGGRSAVYNLDAGLFEDLVSRTRGLAANKPRPMRFWLSLRSQ
ncbi:MAG: hypothetical protein RMK45_06875 [Armatimonadota bacterium]|nr:hypothetical protein [Armatimonadota bacterium]